MLLVNCRVWSLMIPSLPTWTNGEIEKLCWATVILWSYKV